MEKNRKSILFFGSHLVDSYLQVEEGVLEKYGIVKGKSAIYDDLVPSDNLTRIVNDYKFTDFEIGGSSVNTAKAYSLLGGKSGIVCSYGNDENGRLIEKVADKLGIDLFAQVNNDFPTSYLRIMITPDGQRTVIGSFFPSFNLISSKFDFQKITGYDYVLVEAYSFTDDDKNDAIFKTLENVEKYDSKLIFALSNAFCVSKFRDKILEFVFHKNCKGIVGNNFEYLELFPQFSNINEVVDYLVEYNKKNNQWEFLVITNGADGAWLLHKDEIYFVKAPEVDIVDTTGAGDYFSAGALFGIINGYGLEVSGKLGNILAADVISRLGVQLSEKSLEMARSLLVD